MIRDAKHIRLLERRALVLFVALFAVTVKHSAGDDNSSKPKAYEPLAQKTPFPFIRGLRVYGGTDELQPPIIFRADSMVEGQRKPANNVITIDFDVDVSPPPNLRIKFWHCNRDWRIDDNIFLVDFTHNQSSLLNFTPAPNGIEHYKYHYCNQFPDEQGIVRFGFSGNWIFQILDAETKEIYAEGRFMVVEPLAEVSMGVTNDYLTEASFPYYMIHKVAVSVNISETLYREYVTTADVYQNWRFYDPYRIDVNDRDPYTFVEGINSLKKKFIISNVFPGNEYRRLDLSNITFYPRSQLVKLVQGNDLSRYLHQGDPDMDGGGIVNQFTGLESDYLEVMFRLDLPTRLNRDIFVVGAFNGWHPTLDDRLRYDDTLQLYYGYKWIRRGIYDYQYVTGMWDSEHGRAIDQDWLELEGNDWRTEDIYSAVIYYNDPRFGGFDRIIGFARGSSIVRTVTGDGK